MSTAFAKHMSTWRQRREQLGDAAVGPKAGGHAEQGEQITTLLRGWLTGAPDRFYTHGLDFGCGWGRLTGLIAEHCGHVWAVDLLDEWTTRAALLAPTITPVCLQSHVLPFESNSIDLIVDILTLQGIRNEALMLQSCQELRRVAAPGATILSLHQRVEKGLRSSQARADQLGLDADWIGVPIEDIDQTGDKYTMLAGAKR